MCYCIVCLTVYKCCYNSSHFSVSVPLVANSTARALNSYETVFVIQMKMLPIDLPESTRVFTL